MHPGLIDHDNSVNSRERRRRKDILFSIAVLISSYRIVSFHFFPSYYEGPELTFVWRGTVVELTRKKTTAVDQTGHA